MRITHIKGIALIAFAACLMAGCDNDNGNGSADASVSSNELAVKQINTQTCVDRQPQDINALTIVENTEAIDVATLTPACKGG